MTYKYLQLFFIGFLGGIYVNNAFENTVLTSIFFMALFCVLVALFLYIRQYRHIVIPLYIGIFLGVSTSFLTLSTISQNQKVLESLRHQKQEIYITIIDIQKKSDFSVGYIGNVISIGDTDIRNRNIRTTVQIPSNFEFGVGDTLKYMSKLYPISDFNGFSYKNYQLSRGIYFLSYTSTPDVVSSGDSSQVFLFFSDLRSYFLGIMDELYPSKERIFLGGILLGAREDIPSDLKEDFNKSGLTHFIAVSGFNITILIVFFGYIFQYLPIWLRSICIFISVVGFTILVGFSPPVIRASIMGLVAYFILISGRNPVSISIVLFAAFCMVFLSPLSLNYDVSLHLSFLAVVGIIYTQDIYKRIFSFLPGVLAIREAFVLTLSAMSFTLPIMIFQFGYVSVLVPIANIAVAWTIPIAMLLGFLSLLGYLILPQLGYVIAFIDWVFLKYDITMVHLFGNSDWAIMSFDFGVYGVYIQAVYYILLIFCIMLYRIRKKAT